MQSRANQRIACTVKAILQQSSAALAEKRKVSTALTLFGNNSAQQIFAALRVPRDRKQILRSCSSGSGNQQHQKEKGLPWTALGVVAIGAGGLGAYLSIRNDLANQNSAASVVVGQTVGRATLGGSFELLDQNNKVVRDTDFKGRWRFIYFGFTYCPDICPNELMRMVEVIKTLESTNVKLEPLFITIDPARDGPEQLKSYLSDWHPKIIGLTGTQEQIDDVCKKFRVYYSKAQLGPNPSDYLIDHSVLFYLMDPDGEFVAYFAKNMTPAQMANRIAEHALEYAAAAKGRSARA